MYVGWIVITFPIIFRGAGDKFITLVVKMLYNKMSVFSRGLTHSACQTGVIPLADILPYTILTTMITNTIWQL